MLQINYKISYSLHSSLYFFGCCIGSKELEVSDWKPQRWWQLQKTKVTLQRYLEAVMCNCRPFLIIFSKTSEEKHSPCASLSCRRFFQSCRRPSHTRWTASWGTSRTVKRTTAPNAQHGPARQGCTRAAAAAPHLCLILCLLELLLSETLAHESGHTKATQGTSFRVTGIRWEKGEKNTVTSTGKEGIDKERHKWKRG